MAIRYTRCGIHLALVYLLTLRTCNTLGQDVVYKLNIGIYSPGSSTWAELATKCVSRLVSRNKMPSHAKIELLNITQHMQLSYSALKKVRGRYAKRAITAFIGPSSDAFMMLAEDLQVPYFITTSSSLDTKVDPRYLFHMLPHRKVVHQAILDVVEAYGWRTAAVMYEGSEGLQLIGELMSMSNVAVRAWKVHNSSDVTSIRQQLLEMRQLNNRKIIVVSGVRTLSKIFGQALRLSMLSDRYSWIADNFHQHQMDYSPYIYTRVNYTSFSPLINHTLTVDPALPKTDAAVVMDSLSSILAAVAKLKQATNKKKCTPPCSSVPVLGKSLEPFVTEVSLEGYTGQIEFDDRDRRVNMTLEVLGLSHEGLQQIGRWRQGSKSWKERLHIPARKMDESVTKLPVHPLGSATVKIVTIQDAPFVMVKKDHKKRKGNDRFEGFLIDLIAEIAKPNKGNFQYELYLSPDGKYGSKVDDNTWNGMIEELRVGNASMCLGAISITSERERVVDFTKPFMQKTFNILMKKPKEKSSVFQFMWPLSGHVWGLTISSTIVVGVLLCIMDKLNPNNINDATARRFGLRESMWFIYASLVGAGTEMSPRNTPSRILSGAWWFFSLILISSYTANLAAFLTVTKIETPIKSLADLAGQTKIKYGTVKNTYCNSFFENSDNDLFKKMWTFMGKLHPDSMVENSKAGIKKVKEGNYAFIWDAPINRFTTMFECDTMVVGEPFDEKGLGIGVPLGAAYRDEITMQILNLNEEGIIPNLQKKWWSGGKCTAFSDAAKTRTKELNLFNVAGIFVVLCAGIGAALIGAVLEFLIRKTRLGKKRKEKEDPVDPSARTLKSSIHFNGLSTYQMDPENSM